jgi:cysteine desulfurase
MVSIMAANNETGVLAPLAEVGRICRETGVVFHTDGVQAFGKIPLNVRELDVDLVSLSGHKIYGPKGIGALWIHPDLEISPQIHGGGQECGLRSGTLNVPAIVGFGEAARIGREEMALEGRRIGAIRDRLQRALLSGVPGARVHGASAPRLPGHLSIGLPRVDAKALLAELDEDVAASTVSACSTGCTKPSHVLEAMGVPPGLSRGTIRLTVGRFTGPEDVDHVARRIVETLRSMSQLMSA